jgi:hypothetical protein
MTRMLQKSDNNKMALEKAPQTPSKLLRVARRANKIILNLFIKF